MVALNYLFNSNLLSIYGFLKYVQVLQKGSREPRMSLLSVKFPERKKELNICL